MRTRRPRQACHELWCDGWYGGGTLGFREGVWWFVCGLCVVWWEWVWDEVWRFETPDVLRVYLGLGECG